MNEMTRPLISWLKQRLDTFELRVRGGRTKKGRENNDLYYSAGWADGYKAAQTDARAASRDHGFRLASGGTVDG